MSEQTSKRYEAALFLQSGLESKGEFDDPDKAKAWLEWRSQQVSTKQKAWVIYDRQDNRRRILTHDPAFVLAGKTY